MRFLNMPKARRVQGMPKRMVEKGWCRLIEKQLDSIWIWLNMIEMHLNTCKCVILCYPRSYCTMAFFKGDTSYKLTCPSTAPHAIHCPCHLLQAASAAIRFVLHTSQQWLCDVPVEEKSSKTSMVFRGRTTNSFGVLMVRMVWGIFSWFWMATQENWSLQLQATALWDNRRTWRHPGVEGPRGVFRRFGFPFRVGSQILKFKRGATCHICYDGTIQIIGSFRCCVLSLYVVVACCFVDVGPKESQLEASLVMVLEAEKRLTSMIGEVAGCFRQQILPFCPWNYPLVKQHSNVYNIPMFNRRIIFKRYMFHCYVSFQSETAKAL